MSQVLCVFLDPDVDTALPVTTAEGGRMLEIPERERLHVDQLVLRRANGKEPHVCFESLLHHSQPVLLMSTESESRVKVNGAKPLRITRLTSGDLVDIDGVVLHVAVKYHPYIGPPEDGHLGVKCGYCRVPIENDAKSRVLVCVNCNKPTHFHGEDVPVEERMECAKMSSHCGHCQAELILTPGYSYVPAL
ncbi:MAG: hypothetical protein RIC12_01540 [Pirellulales bacterium]